MHGYVQGMYRVNQIMHGSAGNYQILLGGCGAKKGFFCGRSGWLGWGQVWCRMAASGGLSRFLWLKATKMGLSPSLAG